MKWSARWRSRLGKFRQSVSQRLGYPVFKENVLQRRVPETPWYQGDGATLTTLLVVQIVTGITMTLYYSNGADYAYDSVRHITDQLTLGWLVRGIHYWTAGTMVVVMLLHVSRHLLLGGYKAPREGTWILGVFQFFLVLTMSFTGYVLRWDERAVYAARVVLNMFHHVPLIGDRLVMFIQGGHEMGSATLTRFFSVHIWIVPSVLVSLVFLHLYLVVIHGVTSKAERKTPVRTAKDQKKIYKEASRGEETGEWFYPITVFLTGTMAFLVFLIPFTLALVYGPREMFPEGNLIARSMPQEEWWFWWYSALIAQMPAAAAPSMQVAFPLVVFLGMVILPFLDRSPNRGLRKRPFWAAFVVVYLIGLLYLSDLRTRSPWTGWPDADPPGIPVGIVLSAESETGRMLFARYGCNSCHAVSGSGRQVGPDLARVDEPLSRDRLARFVLDPPEEVPMPGYRGRISKPDLDRVVDFVLVAQTFPRE